MEISNNFNNTYRPYFNGSLAINSQKLVVKAAQADIEAIVKIANEKGELVDSKVLDAIKQRTTAIITALKDFAAGLHKNTEMTIGANLPQKNADGEVYALFSNNFHSTTINIPIKSAETESPVLGINIFEQLIEGLKRCTPQNIDSKILDNIISTIIKKVSKRPKLKSHESYIQLADTFSREIGVTKGQRSELEPRLREIIKEKRLEAREIERARQRKQNNIDSNNKLLKTLISDIYKNIGV